MSAPRTAHVHPYDSAAPRHARAVQDGLLVLLALAVVVLSAVALRAG